MTEYYVTSCKYCSETIEMREISENYWRPYEWNGVRHDCKGRQSK